MSKITWDALGERIYEVGLDHGVIYFPEDDSFGNGIPWNGLTKVEDPGVEIDGNALYSGDVKVESEDLYGDYTGSIEALTYPDEFEACIGSISDKHPGLYITRQNRSAFGLSYRTLVGSDVEGTNKGYKIHLLYNIYITGFARTYATLSDNMDLSAMKWDYEAFPFITDDDEVIHHIVLNVETLPPSFKTFIEDTLYGTETTVPRLLMPDELLEEYYNHFDIWTGNPASMIYPASTVYPALDNG